MVFSCLLSWDWKLIYANKNFIPLIICSFPVCLLETGSEVNCYHLGCFTHTQRNYQNKSKPSACNDPHINDAKPKVCGGGYVVGG